MGSAGAGGVLADGGQGSGAASGSAGAGAGVAAGAGGSGPLTGAGTARDAGLGESDAGAPGAAPGELDAGSGPDDDAGVALEPEVVERLSELSSRLAPLAARTASFWFEHGPDAVSGGFHGTLDRQGNPIAPDDKGLIQEVRHLWMLSTWYERREATDAVRAQAEQVYAFIRRSFVDAADGAFVYMVSRDGSRVVDAKKQLFAESYAIYALATYARVFGDAEATALALGRFRSIDASRHDAANGGYDQRGDPGTLSAGAEKDTNTHLHLLEAFSALYEATQDTLVGARLDELVELFATRLRQPSGYVHAEFSLSWAPTGTPRVSYGHDLETAWLLLEAARVLGRAGDPALRAAALDIAVHSAGPGFDAQNGGYFSAGPNGAGPDDLAKNWWVQFEALAGLWWGYELDPNGFYLDRLTRTLEWLEFSEDLPAGEWFAITNPDGSAAGANYKGDQWKASYHSVRALLFVQDWIDAKLAGQASP